ncbi:MAG: glycerol-3-phosphate 1-O-acyltransferase PlsY [Puniceicoccales bacterium]|nr:glycerol-3-phosphate 1-O-acyltransferase PlsY [Puniceicoccales bacterium]
MDWNLALIALVGYFFGAIPFAVIIAKWHKINILICGSGNPGATNVYRTAGKLPGRIVFLCDVLKGFVAVRVAGYLANGNLQLAMMIGLIGAFFGHNFSLFIKCRGGKGISVLMGGMAAAMTNVLLIGLLTWGVVFLLTGYVSLASICYSAILPLCSYLFGYDKHSNLIVLFLSAFAIARHIPNIRRLLTGTEYRFTPRESGQ